MSERPVFIPSKEDNKHVETINITFNWFSGFSVSQKRKSIKSLHQGIFNKTGIKEILEISTKSENELGVKSSAFNLRLKIGDVTGTVESIYQGSKIFKNGGPYCDIYSKSSYDAKKDERIKTSGELKEFSFQNETWGVNENFYDWLYLNALNQNIEIKENLLNFNAFTDIEFNPKKSYNCQAFSAALFCSFYKKRISLDEIESKETFNKIFPKDELKFEQLDLF
tara:strand:+ start:1155 stop:1826 length:672 start_codon:yes stop_codon:yes gene_type:complete